MKKIIIILIFLLCIFETFSYLSVNVELKNSNEDFVKKMLKKSNYHLNTEEKDSNLVYNFLNIVNDVEINKPVTILKNSLDYNKDRIDFSYVVNNIMDTPRVYIYSSHPTELYSSDYLDGYDISPGVIMASMILQERLNALGITTIVDEDRINDYLNGNNLDYNLSYSRSRELISNTLKKYPDLDLIIDLHRDAISKEITTTTIKDINYAKIMFVQSTKCEDNLDLANSLSNSLNNNYPGLSRGLYTKHEFKFNQDLNPNIILLELGSNYNTINEVVNTIDALANVIKEKLN